MINLLVINLQEKLSKHYRGTNKNIYIICVLKNMYSYMKKLSNFYI